jgi:Protein of unknown function (DUF3096)
MNLHLSIGPLAALIAGILILVAPKLLNYIVALYLIIVGVVGLFGSDAGALGEGVTPQPNLFPPGNSWKCRP